MAANYNTNCDVLVYRSVYGSKKKHSTLLINYTRVSVYQSNNQSFMTPKNITLKIKKQHWIL